MGWQDEHINGQQTCNERSLVQCDKRIMQAPGLEGFTTNSFHFSV